MSAAVANSRRSAEDAKGMTLIELLVVIAVIGVLAALVFPVLAAARQRAVEKVCISNLRQLGMAVRMYMSDHDNGRPDRLHVLVPAYVTDRRVLVCPADDVPGGYGTRVIDFALGPPIETFPLPTSYSYYRWTDEQWAKLEERGPRAGFIMDFCHGEYTSTPRPPADWPNYWPEKKGRALRLCMDGSVRVVFIPKRTDGWTSWWWLVTYPPD